MPSLKINNHTLSKTFGKSEFIYYKNSILTLAATCVIYVSFVTTALEYSNRNVEGISERYKDCGCFGAVFTIHENLSVITRKRVRG
jgi:hypothetical protein